LPTQARAAVEVATGDVRDAGSLEAAMRGCDIVLHLAALIGIPYSYVTPEAYVATNVGGTLNLLQAARRADVRRVVVTSTSEVYGSARVVPMDETHPLQAQSPYAASKIAADKLAESFARSFGLDVVTLRPFNAFGPRQSTRAVIPSILTQLLDGADAVQVGALTTRRDFTFVADLAQAFVAVAGADGVAGLELNVASGVDVAIGTVARALIERLRPQARLCEDEARLRPAASEVERLCGSSQRLRELTGWQPAWTLERGLDATIEWFRQPQHRAHYREGYRL
jgi:nucleoside-diphosphate-sugar epimerase